MDLNTTHDDNNGFEYESKFHVNGVRASEIFGQLSKIDTIAGLSLGPVESVENLDTFFDTSKLFLANIGAVLRIRIKDGAKIVVTLKTQADDEETYQQDAHLRKETEGSPDEALLVNIAEKLRELTVITDKYSPFSYYFLGLRGLFAKWGLREIFSSRNNRLGRKIYLNGTQHVATMFMDSVEFFNDYKQRPFFEIEIELTNANVGRETIQKLSTELLQRFPHDVFVNDKSKYQRGLEFIGVTDDFSNETKLIILGDVAPVEDYLMNLRTISTFDLGEPDLYEIQDAYFDTPDQKLYKSNCYLRIRRRRSQETFTLRHYRRSAEKQVIDQFEIKDKASIDTLLRIIQYLDQSEILPRLELPGRFEGNVSEVLLSMGFQLIQRLETNRSAFHVYDQNRHFANVKLDKVKYFIGGETYIHNEIEISTSSDFGDITKVQIVGFSLISKFDSKIVIGDDPKHVTGLKLAAGQSFKAQDAYRALQMFERRIADPETIYLTGSDLDEEGTFTHPIFGTPPKGSQFRCDVFMIMPFRKEFDDIYRDAIIPAVEDLELLIKRGDDFPSAPGVIMDEVWAAINVAKFVIVETTIVSPNVYYELGIAHTLGKPAIVITSDKSTMPFDIRHRRYLVYENTIPGGKKLQLELSNQIRALLADINS